MCLEIINVILYLHLQLFMYACMHAAFVKFYSMQREVQAKRLSADLEIKLRGLYFDRIPRDQVELVIADIYKHVLLLEGKTYIGICT